MGSSSSAQSSGVSQPSSRATRGPAKVLCLHGAGSNRREFSDQLAPVDAAMNALGGGPELVFLNGPLDAKGLPNEIDGKVPPEGGDFESKFGGEGQWRFTTGGHWRYWSTDQNEAYGGSEELETWFIRVSKEHGPFLGVMGFGEGGAAASLLAGLARPGRVWPNKLPTLQCLVSLSTAQLWRLDQKSRAQELLKSHGELPVMSLHIIGEEDKLKHHMEETRQLFKNPIVRYHKEGHRPLPGDEEDAETLAKQIAAFIRFQASTHAFIPAEIR